MRNVYDVVVVGAGPAGIAAAVGAKAGGAGSVLLLDRDDRIGGILPQCVHPGFGLKVFKKELTGPEYAERYAERLAALDVDLLLDAAAVGIGADKRVILSSPGTGVRSVEARAVVLAMGCRERTRGNIRIPGFRPAGIMTAGTAQRLINREGMMVGERIVVVGSGDIGLIMARRCTVEGARVEAVIEKLPYPSGLSRNVVQCLRDFDIPLHLGHMITYIEGKRRVEGVRFAKSGVSPDGARAKEEHLKCDTVLLSVGLIPEIELVLEAGIPVDPCSGGPVVDQLMHTEIDGFFAAGNLVQVYDLVDWVSIDGERAGRSAAAYAAGKLGARRGSVRIKRGKGVKCAVPQRVCAYGGEEPDGVRLYLRVESVLKKPVFRFTGPGGVVGEVKKPYAVPSEIVECDVSGFVGEISADCEITVDVMERGRGGRPPDRRHPFVPDGAGGETEIGNRPPSADGSSGMTIPVTCILCPDSCLVRVFTEGGVIRAEGARCAKGAGYAIREVTDPRRTFTSSVRVLCGSGPVCPVRTTKPIRKDGWREARRLVGGITARAPVRCGQTLMRDFLERGIDLIATMTVGTADNNIHTR